MTCPSSPVEHFGLEAYVNPLCPHAFRHLWPPRKAPRQEGENVVYLLRGRRPVEMRYSGAVLYVGVSSVPLYRWAQHDREKQWTDDVLLVEQRNCGPDRDVALAYEAALIDALDPFFNRTGRGYYRRRRWQQRNSIRLPQALDLLAERWTLPT